MNLIFTPDESDTNRATGYATVEYSSDNDEETVIETTQEELTAIFEDAKASGGSLDGAEETIDAAIENPLSFQDYLILVDGGIEFDDAPVRDEPGE